MVSSFTQWESNEYLHSARGWVGMLFWRSLEFKRVLCASEIELNEGVSAMKSARLRSFFFISPSFLLTFGSTFMCGDFSSTDVFCAVLLSPMGFIRFALLMAFAPVEFILRLVFSPLKWLSMKFIWCTASAPKWSGPGEYSFKVDTSRFGLVFDTNALITQCGTPMHFINWINRQRITANQSDAVYAFGNDSILHNAQMMFNNGAQTVVAATAAIQPTCMQPLLQQADQTGDAGTDLIDELDSQDLRLSNPRTLYRCKMWARALRSLPRWSDFFRIFMANCIQLHHHQL
jgi:hypothetical protein